MPCRQSPVGNTVENTDFAVKFFIFCIYSVISVAVVVRLLRQMRYRASEGEIYKQSLAASQGFSHYRAGHASSASQQAFS